MLSNKKSDNKLINPEARVFDLLSDGVHRTAKYIKGELAPEGYGASIVERSLGRLYADRKLKVVKGTGKVNDPYVYTLFDRSIRPNDTPYLYLRKAKKVVEKPRLTLVNTPRKGPASVKPKAVKTKPAEAEVVEKFPVPVLKNQLKVVTVADIFNYLDTILPEPLILPIHGYAIKASDLEAVYNEIGKFLKKK